MLPYHINDLEFVNEVVDSFIQICKDSEGTRDFQAFVDPKTDLPERSVSEMNASCQGTISYSLSDYPNAKPGQYISFFILIISQFVH